MLPSAAQRKIQAAAKLVLAQLAASIEPRDTERSLAERAVALLREQGITETWYHQCPALVLLGSRSCESVSGRDYEPAHELVGDFNVVTIDLSPLRGGLWGDCARTIAVERGRAASHPESAELRAGLHALAQLHRAMQAFVRPETSFGELFAFGHAEIERLGFENLDFKRNLGHSIASTLGERCYIEAGNARRLADARLFTFEPHIRQGGGRWGFKHEDIYWFGSDRRAHVL